MHHADPEARLASWQWARQAGVLSPNDVRLEEGWPASTDPTADSIEPPAMGGAKPEAEGAAGSDKVARLDDHTSRHAAD